MTNKKAAPLRQDSRVPGLLPTPGHACPAIRRPHRPPGGEPGSILLCMGLFSRFLFGLPLERDFLTQQG
jgi:hypothetical protein